MSESIKELRDISYEKLIEKHDSHAKSTVVGVDFYLKEISRRDQEMQTKAMLRYTKWITLMTLIMTVSTIINVIIAIK